MQHETSNVGKGNVEAVSVAIPAVMRASGDGENRLIYFSYKNKPKQMNKTKIADRNACRIINISKIARMYIHRRNALLTFIYFLFVFYYYCVHSI